MDREESKGAYRVTLLFIVVALFALFLDRTQTAASHEEVIELAGATSVHLQLDKCELLYIEEPPRDTTVRFFDDRVSGEQWLEVHITVNPAIQIVQEVSEDGSHFDVRISNMVEPQYARYEGYLCVMEYHYPKGETIPATTVTLSGRHASTISAGRCEVCVLTTKSDAQAPRGCIQPYPFVSDSEDGTCQATPNWGENDVIIQTQDGEKTPAIIGMRNAMMKNLNITVLGNGFVAMTDVHIHGVADVVASSGSVNIELSHAARVEAENKDNRICITDASYYVPEEVVEVDDGGNATNTVEPNAFNPLFLGHFSPVLCRLFTVLSRFPASWRQDGENGRKMAQNGRNLGEKRPRNSGAKQRWGLSWTGALYRPASARAAAATAR